MAEVIEPTFTQVARGLLGAEGPVFNKNEEFYMVSPEKEVDGKFAGEIVAVNLSTGESSLISAPSVDGYGGVPAGCQFDKDGNLWVADMRLGLLKVDVKDKTFTQVFKKDSEGHAMRGLNDCSLDYHGNLWLTAPAGDIAPADYIRSTEKPFGSVMCMTASGQCKLVDTGYLFSNGIAVQHDSEGNPKLLIVAETHTKSLWAYDIKGPGEATGKRLWASLPGDHDGGPDGMDFDVDGNLLVANWGSSHIEVFGPNGGALINRIKCPFKAPSNLHFRPGSSDVYVTEHENHALWVFNWRVKGRKEACEM